jgi:hypothetical protein
MKKIIILTLLALLLVITGTVAANAGGNYQAHLTGDAQVPSPVDTLSQGQALFKVSADGSSMQYKLIVANLDDVFMAHIHLGPVDGNGPVAAWLYPSAPPPQLIPGTFSGVLAEGTITAADLTGPLAGMSLDALLAEMDAGNAYVNVHTLNHPPGEIRGQIR